jgi:hypothetical protein
VRGAQRERRRRRRPPRGGVRRRRQAAHASVARPTSVSSGRRATPGTAATTRASATSGSALVGEQHAGDRQDEHDEADGDAGDEVGPEEDGAEARRRGMGWGVGALVMFAGAWGRSACGDA